MSGQGEFSGTRPAYPEVLQAFFDREMVGVHTAMPGTVTAYDPATQTATVKLAFLRVFDPDDRKVPYPDLVKVPVVQLQAGASWIRMPVTAGDRVLVIFAERALDTWWLNGGQVDPADSRRFSVADAIAIPGLNPQANAIQALGPANSLEIQNGGLWIGISKAGKVTITNPAGFELVAVLNALLSDTQTLMADLAGYTPASGTPLTTTLPTFPAHLAALVADLVKLSSFT